MNTVHETIGSSIGLPLTRHAWERMSARSLSPKAVSKVLDYGRVSYVRGAAIYAVGRKEVQHYRRHGITLSDLEGIQVVCNPSASCILTVYRNKSLDSLRARKRRSKSRRSRFRTVSA